MNFDRNKPYNDLPGLPPAKTDMETKAILKAVTPARVALASMAAHCKQLPDESVFYNSIFLKEAKESSEIENIVTTNDELYQAMTADQTVTNPNTREVLHYINALWKGANTMRKTGVLTTRTLVEIVNTIKENDEGIRKNKGIKIKNQKTGKIIYTPPDDAGVIAAKLKNLEQYINQKDNIDPLIKMAIIHYQFEAIHPFSDGNGRTGRIINVLYLELQKLLDHPVLFLSKYIIDNKNDYYVKLREVTEENKWEEWILYMLNGVEETSVYTKDKINKIVELMQETKMHIREQSPKVYSKELLEIIFKQPYCKVKFLEEAGIVKAATARKYLNELVKLGILSTVTVGKEKLYVNKKFYEILKF